MAAEVPLKLRVRKLVHGLSDKDLAEQNAAQAQQLVKEVSSRSELHSVLQEIFADLEKTPPVARKLRYRVAAVAVASNEDFFSVPTSGLIVKYLLGFLGHEKHEATQTEMSALVQQVTNQLLALPAHEKASSEEGGAETVVMRRVIAPLLKTGSSGAGKDRAPTACLMAEGSLAECAHHMPSAEVSDTCCECLKLILQLLSSGVLPVTVSEAFAPIRQALLILEGTVPAQLVRKITGVCLQGLKLKDNWHTRKQAALTISTLATSVPVYDLKPNLESRLRSTPGAAELVSQRVGLLAALDSVKYDKIAQVRDAVSKAISELQQVPDEMEEEKEPEASQPPQQENPKPLAPLVSPAKVVAEREKRKSRSRSLSFSKALGFNKLKGALRDVVNKHSDDGPHSPRGGGGRSPRGGDKGSSAASSNAPMSPLGPTGGSPRRSNSPEPPAPPPLAPLPAVAARDRAAAASGPGGGAPRPRAARGAPFASRFRSAAASQSGSNFDVPIEVYCPSSPMPVARDVPSPTRSVEAGGGTKAFDRALEEEEAAGAGRRIASDGGSAADLGSQASGNLDSGAAAGMLGVGDSASSGQAQQQQQHMAGGGAMPFPGSAPFPGQFYGGGMNPAMMGMNPVMAQQMQMNPAMMQQQMQQYMMQMQQQMAAAQGMQGMGGMMMGPGMGMPFMPQPYMMAGPGGMPMQQFAMQGTYPGYSMPAASGVGPQSGPQQQGMVFMAPPAVPVSEQQQQQFGSHSRQASGAWPQGMMYMPMQQQQQVPEAAAGASSRPGSRHGEQQQQQEPVGPEIPAMEHRRQGSKIPSPLRPPSSGFKRPTDSPQPSPRFPAEEDGEEEDDQQPAVAAAPVPRPPELIIIPAHDGPVRVVAKPAADVAADDDKAAAAAADKSSSDPDAPVTVFGNPLYKFGKLSINASAGHQAAAVAGGGVSAASVGDDSPSATDEGEEQLSSPDTSRYLHKGEAFATTIAE